MSARSLNITPGGVTLITGPPKALCICDFIVDDHYDDLIVTCHTCNRSCHAVCFSIEDKALIPGIWRCWVCFPRRIDKGRAVRLQQDRQARIEVMTRNKQLEDLSAQEIPEYREGASLEECSKQYRTLRCRCYSKNARI
ncbi:hypothetical protein BDQ12DRAFT_168697 [Crucibulum laeve]|uniref:Zinc finger PHD-type domain-containing protein n=1 Tax=Crucibulum laeve TaxID=68775 RepID=A0A5C3MDC6_9AGAR|nr:hypothetical protein BDQ12DRAFT_168697 [Crucibulum laeve]